MPQSDYLLAQRVNNSRPQVGWCKDERKIHVKYNIHKCIFDGWVGALKDLLPKRNY